MTVEASTVRCDNCGASISGNATTCAYCKCPVEIIVRGTHVSELMEMYVEAEQYVDAEALADEILKEHAKNAIAWCAKGWAQIHLAGISKGALKCLAFGRKHSPSDDSSATSIYLSASTAVAQSVGILGQTFVQKMQSYGLGIAVNHAQGEFLGIYNQMRLAYAYLLHIRNDHLFRDHELDLNGCYSVVKEIDDLVLQIYSARTTMFEDAPPLPNKPKANATAKQVEESPSRPVDETTSKEDQAREALQKAHGLMLEDNYREALKVLKDLSIPPEAIDLQDQHDLLTKWCFEGISGKTLPDRKEVLRNAKAKGNEPSPNIYDAARERLRTKWVIWSAVVVSLAGGAIAAWGWFDLETGPLLLGSVISLPAALLLIALIPFTWQAQVNTVGLVGLSLMLWAYFANETVLLWLGGAGLCVASIKWLADAVNAGKEARAARPQGAQKDADDKMLRRLRPGERVFVILGSAAFVAIGVWMVQDPEVELLGSNLFGNLAGWASILFFGLSGVMGVVGYGGRSKEEIAPPNAVGGDSGDAQDSIEATVETNIKNEILIACCGLGIPWLICIAIFKPMGTLDDGTSMFWGAVFLGSTLGLPIGFVIWMVLRMVFVGDACPHCQRWRAGVHQGRQDLGNETGFKTVTRQAKNNKGEVIRSWNEQVLVRRSYWRDFYVCRFCSGNFFVNRSSESEEG